MSLPDRFWAAVDRHTGLDAHGVSPERRARVRFLAALAAIGVVAGLALGPLSALSGASPWIGLGAALACLAFLLGLRRSAHADRTALAMTGMIVGLGLGATVLLPQPGNPSLAWLMILGLTPLTLPRRAVRLAFVAAPLALAAVLAPPAPSEPGLSPLGGVVGVVFVGVVMVSLMIATHRKAVSELEAELVAQREAEVDLARAAADLRAGADESASSLVTLNHAVRTPLNGLVGVADLLLAEGADDAARAELEELRAASRGVLDVLETLLYLARATARGVSTAAPTDLPATLAAAVARAAAGQRGRRATPVIAAGLVPRVASLDATALRVTLDQLLAGMVRLGLHGVTVAAEQRGDALVVRCVGDRAASGEAGEGAADVADQLGLSAARALATSVGGALVHRVEPGAVTLELSLPSVPVATAGVGWSDVAARVGRPRGGGRLAARTAA